MEIKEKNDKITSNWKNVNNWHWVDKDCLPWSTSYVMKKLKGLKVEDGDLCGKITQVSSVKGDSVVNQRKGKFTCVFDLEIGGNWVIESKKAPKGENVIEGKFKTVEFAYDTDIPNVEIEFTPNGNVKLTQENEKFLKDNFSKAIGEELKGFVKEMIEENRVDVFAQDIEKESEKTNNAVGANVKAHIESGDKKKLPDDTATVRQTVEFSASPMDLFDCLTNSDRMSIWSRYPAEASLVPGGAFSLLNGRVSGVFEELVPGEKIVQSWRLSSWDKGHYSKVSMSITPHSGGSKLFLTQTSVPGRFSTSVNDNWTKFYWWAIRDAFGFGCNIE